jgi:hypothetical protein
VYLIFLDSNKKNCFDENSGHVINTYWPGNEYKILIDNVYALNNLA